MSIYISETSVQFFIFSLKTCPSRHLYTEITRKDEKEKGGKRFSTYREVLPGKERKEWEYGQEDREGNEVSIVLTITLTVIFLK